VNRVTDAERLIRGICLCTTTLLPLWKIHAVSIPFDKENEQLSTKQLVVPD